MAITRDAGYPAEYAQLANAFSQCADGYDAAAVLNASLQMVVMAIGAICKSREATLELTEGYTAHVCGVIAKEVTSNWNRQPQPTDVEVKAS